MPSLIGTYITNNYLKNVRANGTNGRTLVVKIASSGTINNAELNAAIDQITTAHGSDGSGDSAFTIAGLGLADGGAFVSGTTATVYLLIQGTGALTVADVKSAAEGAVGGGAGTFTVSIEAIFQDNYI